jgi:hypothetical protein
MPLALDHYCTFLLGFLKYWVLITEREKTGKMGLWKINCKNVRWME